MGKSMAFRYLKLKVDFLFDLSMVGINVKCCNNLLNLVI